MITLIDHNVKLKNENLKISHTIIPENKLSLEEWLKEFKVSSTYNRNDERAKLHKQKAFFYNYLID